MELKYKVIAFGIMCGFALAASIGARDHFDLSHPVIFYGVHGVLMLLAVMALAVARYRDWISSTLLLRGYVVLALLYAIAATRAAIAPAVVTLVGIVTIVIWVASHYHSEQLRSGAAHE